MTELTAKRDRQMLKMLQEHPFLTNTQASNMGIGSPTKQISNLRAAGYNIQGTWTVGIDQFGEKCRYMEYRYEPNE